MNKCNDILRAGTHISPGQIRIFVEQNRERLSEELSDTIDRAKAEFADLSSGELLEGLVSDIFANLEGSLTIGTEISVEMVVEFGRNFG